jgi:hypothetical protein
MQLQASKCNYKQVNAENKYDLQKWKSRLCRKLKLIEIKLLLESKKDLLIIKLFVYEY